MAIIQTIRLSGHVGNVDIEDGGAAQIAEIDTPLQSETPHIGDESFFVRLHSWNESKPPQHPVMDRIKGKKVRITIEVYG